MSVYEALQKRRLKEIQYDFICSVKLPDIDDEVKWKKLWEQGVEIEATYIRAEHWSDVKPLADKGVGHSFTHETKTVHFRRKK